MLIELFGLKKEHFRLKIKASNWLKKKFNITPDFYPSQFELCSIWFKLDLKVYFSNLMQA